MWQYMRNTYQLAVEVHCFSLSAGEAAERSRILRTLLLRGARRFAQRYEDCNHEVENPEVAEVLRLDSVEK
jgi:hypothetical protein